jgi:LacI family xylobiose transport system transcriptional regulator
VHVSSVIPLESFDNTAENGYAGFEDRSDEYACQATARRAEMTTTNDPTRVTLAQIASLAQVSTSTVSKVLNGRRDVAQYTRARVQDLLTESGYSPLGGPQSSSEVVELVFHELDPIWAMEVIRGVAHVAQASGLSVVLTESGNRQSPAPDWINGVLGRRPRGVVLIFADLSADQRAALGTRGIPFAVIDPTGDPAQGVPSVGSANWVGGLAATRHLIELGHRRIAVISGPLTMMCSRARVDGYQSALNEAGIPFDPQLWRQGDFQSESGYIQGGSLLRMDEPPTAIFAGKDLQAMGVYRVAHELGFAIPKDVSLIGYDDIRVAQWLGPSLTTVRQPLTEMAEEATRMVLRLAAGDTLQTERLELATELVVRASTAPPRAGGRGRKQTARSKHPGTNAVDPSR